MIPLVLQLSFFFYTLKALWRKDFAVRVQKISFIVSKLTTPKSKLSDSNLPIFIVFKSRWNFSQKNSFIVTEISFIVGEKFQFDGE